MAEKNTTLTNQEILNLHAGLDALANGIVDRAGGDKGTEITRFDFDDKLSWNLAKNLDIAERAVALFQKARKALGAKHGVVERMPLTVESAPTVAAYQEAEAALLEKTQDLSGVLRLARSELQKGNKIPAGVLKNVLAILEDK